MSSIVVSGNTSGAVTLSAPAVAGTVTVTLPTTTGTMLTTASSTGISGSAISSGTVPEAYGGTGTSTGYYGFKNRIINGAMVIDQRNAGASVTPTDGQFCTDRFSAGLTQASKFSFQQSTDAPTGFKNSIKVTSLSAYSVTSGDLFEVRQNIEGYNIADLGFGTASASTITLSFWVKSSLTGTFGGALGNDGSSRSYPFTYTISVANTFEYKTVTIAGDTTGTWLTTNGIGMRVRFSLGAGSTYSGTSGAWATATYTSATGATSVVGTNGATFFITGVQLEKGSTATSFDYRPFTTEFQLCQRYCQKSYNLETAPGGVTQSGIVAILANNSTYGEVFQVRLPTAMRSSPTVTTYNPTTGTSGSIRNNTASTNLSANINNTSQNGLSNLDVALTAGSVFLLHYLATSEL